jgi:uncharacterized membrane protein
MRTMMRPSAFLLLSLPLLVLDERSAPLRTDLSADESDILDALLRSGGRKSFQFAPDEATSGRG